MSTRPPPRRQFLREAGGAVCAAVAAPSSWRSSASNPRRLGAQLYTVRDQLAPDSARATLSALAAIGYREREVLRATLPTVAPLAKELGLAPVSVHVETPLVTGDRAPWESIAKVVPQMAPPPASYRLAEAVADAAAAGARYVVCPYLLPGERGGGLATYLRLAARLNAAGEVARAGGLQLCYHNHGFEFVPLADGRRPLDVLLAETDARLVALELDVFWVAFTGADPVALLRQYAGRVPLVHLKDKARLAATATDEARVPPAAFTEVGSGTLDFPAILKAAAAAGTRHYLVEQDHTPGPPLDSLKKSFGYLTSIVG